MRNQYLIIFVSFAIFCLIAILGINVISQNKEITDDKVTVEDSQTKLQDSDETQKLIKILTDKKESADVILATIETLGNMKANEAIPILTEYLDYEKICNRNPPKYVEGVEIDGTEIGPRRTCGSYPATSALIQIGKPSLPALVKVIEEEKSESLKSQNALYTIQQIFVEDLSEGVKYLEDAMNISATQMGKQRLLVAVEKTREGGLRIKNSKQIK